jgi:hypothetical protein
MFGHVVQLAKGGGFVFQVWFTAVVAFIYARVFICRAFVDVHGDCMSGVATLSTFPPNHLAK